MASRDAVAMLKAIIERERENGCPMASENLIEPALRRWKSYERRNRRSKDKSLDHRASISRRGFLLCFPITATTNRAWLTLLSHSLSSLVRNRRAMRLRRVIPPPKHPNRAGRIPWRERKMIDADAMQELLAQVPKNPDEPLPGVLRDEELDGFARRTGITPPPDLRAWLKICNGPCVGPGGLFGIRNETRHLNIESILDVFPFWKSVKWIPIAGDGCGNYYVLPTQGEFGQGFPVLFIDTHETCESPAFIAASDLGHFLVFLLEKELGKGSWPFSERAVTAKDPAILGFSNAPLPWRAG